MKHTIWKSTIREIKQSMGRFLAIFAIIALGVAFFAGLTITKTAMVQTAEEYLEGLEFYDYRLLSTMGFRQEEVEFLQRKDEVQAVEGAVSFDIICRSEDGNDSVLKAHSITEELNRIEVLVGRMPTEPDECVVDANLFDESHVGQKIRLSDNNAEDDLDKFAYAEYTIVGIVQSPLYIQFERGSTSLGSGKLSGYFYIPLEGFDTDYFTEIYVNFSENFSLYSDEYQKEIDEKLPSWEDYAKEAANLNFAEIKVDAETELADAKKEFETERADAEKELADAKEELDDAEIQIADGEEQIADAKKEIADAIQTINEKETELADAEQELADKEKELQDGEKALQNGIAQWNTAKSELEQSEAELLLAQADLEIQKETMAENEAQLLEAEAVLNQNEQYLIALKQTLQNAGAGAGQLTEIEAQLMALSAERMKLEAGKQEMMIGMATIASYEKQITEGLAQIAASKKELERAWSDISSNQKKINDGKTAIADAKLQITEGKEKLEDARTDLADGEKTLLENEAELLDARREYEDGLKEYEDGWAEFLEEIAEAEQEIADAEQDIRELEEPDSYVLGRDTNVGYVCFENDSTIIEGIAKVFPVFFFLVAALVCITTMNRMVEEQRTQIGVLKALGYSEATIMSKYMFYSGTAAIMGCIVGYIGGTILFPNVIWYAYGIMYRMNNLLYVFDWKLALISFVVSILCSMGATWLSCRVELSQVAAQLMRPKAPKAGKRIFLEYITFIWKRMKFLSKVSIRNIFRYKKRLFMMVMGISGCTALLVTGFGVKDSIANIATQQYGEVQTFDITLVLKESFAQEDARLISETADLEGEAFVPVNEVSFDLVTEEGRKAVNVIVFDKDADMTPFIDLHTEEKEAVAFPVEGEVVLSHKVAKELGVQVGDTVTLQNEDMQTITARLSGIHQNFIYNYAYINNQTYEQQMGEETEYKSVYLNLPEETDLYQIAAALMQEDNVVTVTINDDMTRRLNSMMESLDLIVVVIILCAGSLAFIVLYNLTNINITERIREIATIQVLGFNKKETESYVFNENMVLAGMGIVVGMVLGHYLHLFVMNEVSIDMISFDVHVRPISYVYSIILTFAFAWIVNRIMGRKLDKISMTESLKSVD